MLGSTTFSFSWSSDAGSSFSAASLFLFFYAACHAAPAAFHCALRQRPWIVLGIYWSAREEGQHIGMISHVVHLFTEIQNCRENVSTFYTAHVSTTSALEVATESSLSLEGSRSRHHVPNECLPYLLARRNMYLILSQRSTRRSVLRSTEAVFARVSNN